MKKINYLVLLLITVLCVTGCGEKTPEQLLDSAIEKMSKVNSYKSKVEMEVGSDLFSQVINIEGEYAKNSSHEILKITLAGNSGEQETYTIQKDDKFYTYTNINGKEWTYSVTDVNKEKNSNINNIASNYKSVKKVKSEKEGYTKLEVVLDNSSLKDLIDEEESLDGIDITKDLTANIYIKDGYIAIMKIDLRNTLTDDYAEDITKYTMYLEWSNYNKVTEIEIPEEVTKDAKLEEKE